MAVEKALYYSVVEIGIADLRAIDPLMLTLTDEQKCSYQAVQEWCQNESVFVCTADDDQYHFKFRQVYSAPYVLTLMGNTELLNRELLAVVGPRRVSDYGKSVVKKLFESVQYYDLVTISGLADGVDMLCHQYSLDKRIPTIAVLGFGLRWALRSAHREMIRAIVDA